MSIEELFERWDKGDTAVQTPRSQLGLLPHDIHDKAMDKYVAPVKEAIARRKSP
jgi:hypothetical protein